MEDTENHSHLLSNPNSEKLEKIISNDRPLDHYQLSLDQVSGKEGGKVWKLGFSHRPELFKAPVNHDFLIDLCFVTAGCKDQKLSSPSSWHDSGDGFRTGKPR
jgi:hypothetical protein